MMIEIHRPTDRTTQNETHGGLEDRAVRQVDHLEADGAVLQPREAGGGEVPVDRPREEDAAPLPPRLVAAATATDDVVVVVIIIIAEEEEEEEELFIAVVVVVVVVVVVPVPRAQGNGDVVVVVVVALRLSCCSHDFHLYHFVCARQQPTSLPPSLPRALVSITARGTHSWDY